MKKYNNIISFGCMCSTALFLKKEGFRSISTIFDWFSSSFESNLKLLNNNFDKLFEKEYLTQKYKDFPHIVDNTYYNVSMPHLFDPYVKFNSQIKKIKKYASKKIKNFYNCICDNCLLVYYCREKDDHKFICSHIDLIKKMIDVYNCDILFITNIDFSSDFPFKSFTVPVNNIHKPYGGDVSFPFENTLPIIEYLNSKYDLEKKENNLKFKNKSYNIFTHLMRKIRKLTGIKLKLK